MRTQSTKNIMNDDTPLDAIAVDTEKDARKDVQKWSFWAVFSSTFFTIFLAEMGDKTQLVTLFMSAESQSPWVVFAGSALALVATSLVGVLLGYWLSRRLSPQTLNLAVAILLLFITGLLVADIINS
jgi:putative Ca2+/H+ antiporter (TMEM165/GDT1 family)